jgi:hypothetical protein
MPSDRWDECVRFADQCLKAARDSEPINRTTLLEMAAAGLMEATGLLFAALTASQTQAWQLHGPHPKFPDRDH